MKIRILMLITIFAITPALMAAEEAKEAKKGPQGVSLFDGKTLDGWTQLNGTATYEVKNGTIVGTTKDGSPNSFLCSDKMYGDFILQFEVKCDTGLNSGVQIRSLQKPGGGRLVSRRCREPAAGLKLG